MNIKQFILGNDWEEWWDRYYLLDWIFAFFVFILSWIINVVVHPYVRYLPPNDPSVSYPLKPDIIPNWTLFVLCFFLPLLIFLLFQVVIKSRHDFHHAFLGLFSSLAINSMITIPLKLLAGRYRPDYDKRIGEDDARMSFPSGHSSYSFAGLLFLTLYFFGKTKIFREHQPLIFLKGTLSLVPLMLASFVAVSRTMDYHHNFDDIVAGSLIGIGSAAFSYFLFFHPLSHRLCNRPRSRKSKSESLLLEKTSDNSRSSSQVRLLEEN